MDKYLSYIAILVLVLQLSQQQYTIDSLNGKIVSFYNPKRNTWLSKDGFNSQNYLVSDSKEVRFKFQKKYSQYFILIAQENNKECAHEDRKYSKFKCEGYETRFIELEYLGNDRYKLTDGTEVLTTSSSCTGCIYLMSESLFPDSDEYKEWEIHVSQCEIQGQLFEGDGTQTCVDQCGVGEYEGQYVCLSCGEGCNTCVEANNCLACANGYIFNGNNCMQAGDLFSKKVAIYAERTNDYCSESDQESLKCKTKNIGNDETFTLDRDDDGYIGIKSYSSKYCRVDEEKLKCDKSSFSGDESKFKLQKRGKYYGIISKLNGKYAKVLKDRKKNKIFFKEDNLIDHGKFQLDLF